MTLGEFEHIISDEDAVEEFSKMTTLLEAYISNPQSLDEKSKSVVKCIYCCMATLRDHKVINFEKTVNHLKMIRHEIGSESNTEHTIDPDVTNNIDPKHKEKLEQEKEKFKHSEQNAIRIADILTNDAMIELRFSDDESDNSEDDVDTEEIEEREVGDLNEKPISIESDESDTIIIEVAPTDSDNKQSSDDSDNSNDADETDNNEELPLVTRNSNLDTLSKRSNKFKPRDFSASNNDDNDDDNDSDDNNSATGSSVCSGLDVTKRRKVFVRGSTEYLGVNYKNCKQVTTRKNTGISFIEDPIASRS